MSEPFPPSRPYFPSDDIEEIRANVTAILRSGRLTLDAYTREFEKRFAGIHKAKHAIAVSSGTASLEIALRCMGLEPRDQVIVPTNTFPSTVGAVIHAGGDPILADLDPKTLCVGIDTVKKTLTDRTRAIVVVHIGGLICPDIKDIAQLCEDRGLFLIEDAAHAHGCSIDNQPAGSIGDVGCFSFYPTKIITTGEGGMITTNSDDIAARARILRDQGKASTESNMIVDLGYSWRMQEISAAIGLVQLRRLSEILNLRRDIADYYSREFSKLSRIKPLRTPTNVVNNFYKYVLILSADVNRDELKSRLRDRGVHCGGEVYWPPVHLQPFYQKHLGTRKGDFPDAEDICQRMICPPLPTGMTPEDAKHVVAEFKEALEEV